MPDPAPVLIHLADTALQTMDAPGHGDVEYRILVSAHGGPSEKLVQGVMTLKPGDTEARHHHDLPETAHVLDGTGTVDLGTVTRALQKGDTVFLPAQAPHAWTAGDDGLTMLFTFPADRWDEIDYHFAERG